MLDPRTLQLHLKKQGLYVGALDGDLGDNSVAAARRYLQLNRVGAAEWTGRRVLIGAQQLYMKELGIEVGIVDGYGGPLFLFALEKWQDYSRDTVVPDELIPISTDWPRQREVVEHYGEVGKNQTMLLSPYPLVLDWDDDVAITKFSIHEKCHDSALRVMQRVQSHYGDQALVELRLNRFAGCLNVRKMRGGKSLSMHSWGIAIDWDASRNQLRWGKSRAALAQPVYDKFWDLWAEEGWISYGRERNFDWMHVQAARL